MSRRLTTIGAVLLGLSSCANTARYTRGHRQSEIRPLAVRAVNWNPTHVPFESVVGVVDDGSQTIVLSPGTAALLRAGALVTASSGHSFTRAAAIPAADGNGQWLVGIDNAGQLYRLRAGRDFEKVSERYGFGTTPLRSLCALNGRGVAFLLAEGDLAISDGRAITHYGVGAVRALACGAGRVALVSVAGVRVLDTATRKLRSFPIAAVGAAFDPRGRLVVATAGALYVEDGHGDLALRYIAEGGPVRGPASTASRVWFTAGEEVGVLENDAVALTRGAQLSLSLSPGAQLFGSATGDLWLVSDGQLRRLSRDDSALLPAERWALLVGPVFARSCTVCHQPGGRAGIDLSTVTGWNARRGVIRERVIEERTMPPSGSKLSDSDRAAILTWLESGP